MSNVVDALESLGRQSQLRYAQGDTLLQALAQGGLNSSLQTAIYKQDAASLQALLGVHGQSIGLVYAPEEQEDEQPDQQKPQRPVQSFATTQNLRV
jgi:hypothetical protein